MSDKYEEVHLPPNRVERIPKGEEARKGVQYVPEEATRDLHVAMGDQADELTETEGVKSEDIKPDETDNSVEEEDDTEE